MIDTGEALGFFIASGAILMRLCGMNQASGRKRLELQPTTIGIHAISTIGTEKQLLRTTYGAPSVALTFSSTPNWTDLNGNSRYPTKCPVSCASSKAFPRNQSCK
jgi:hypothetical protein